MQTTPTPSGVSTEGFPQDIPATNTTPRGILNGDPEAARFAYRAQVESWKLLDTRQDFADSIFMKAHIKAAGLRAPNQLEPASVNRLRRLLTRAGVTPQATYEALGTNLRGYLKLNPRLPLWAALALILEAAGMSLGQAIDLSRGGVN